MKTLDRVFGWLLVISGGLHAFGSWAKYQTVPETALWAFSGTLAAWLVAALNLLRVGRPDDRPLAAVSLVASIAWLVIAIGFGVVIGNVFDPRGMIHAVIALVLAAMSLRTLMRRGVP